MKVAIAFLTKDRLELSKRTIAPLLGSDRYDLHWFDGSDTAAGQNFPGSYANVRVYDNVRGGADPAVVYALTTLLAQGYDFIGLVENDVLLPEGWFGPTYALFERGCSEGLEVGAVSTRAYVDRILCQRDGYALMLNLGWGQQIMTRRAAEITLKYMRTGFTTELRRVFARLSGLDVGTYWAFRTNEHFTTPDWSQNSILAAHGLASLALVPSPCEMVGQKPSLAEQGLKLADAPVEDRRNDVAFHRFVGMTDAIRRGDMDVKGPPVRYRDDAGSEYIFAHQLSGLHASEWSGDWRLKWSPGLGGFATRGFPDAVFETYISGTCRFMIGGGEKGGQVAVEDLKSGYTVRPMLLPEASNQVTQVVVPASVSWRKVRLTVLSGNAILYGIQCQEPQPIISAKADFDHSKLWSV